MVMCTGYELFIMHSSSLIGPNILLRALFSNILYFYSSVSVRDKVSNTYKTTDKIMVLCILIFKFLEMRQEEKRF
jgi:hypothetical protein